MIYNQKQIISKLRRRSAILLIIIFSLLYTIRLYHLDLEFSRFETESNLHELLESEKTVVKLQNKIDSLEKINTVSIKENENKINTKKESKKVDKIIGPDSIKIENVEPVDDVIKDTLNP
jgi:hypothetical protein